MCYFVPFYIQDQKERTLAKKGGRERLSQLERTVLCEGMGEKVVQNRGLAEAREAL